MISFFCEDINYNYKIIYLFFVMFSFYNYHLRVYKSNKNYVARLKIKLHTHKYINFKIVQFYLIYMTQEKKRI